MANNTKSNAWERDRQPSNDRGLSNFQRVLAMLVVSRKFSNLYLPFVQLLLLLLTLRAHQYLPKKQNE